MGRLKHLMFCLVFVVACVGLSGCGSANSGSFTLAADATSVSVVQGGTRTFTVTATSRNQYKGSISVIPDGLPSGVQVLPSSVTIQPGAAATFTLQAASTAALGTTNVTLQGTSGGLNASATLAVVVAPGSGSGTVGTPDFSVTASPNSLVLAPTGAASGNTALAIHTQNGFGGVVTITASALPAGVSMSPATLNLVAGTPQELTFTVGSAAVAGTYPIVLTGTSGALTRTTSLTLTVASPGAVPDFSIAAAPGTATVAQGGDSSTLQVVVMGANGFGGSVSFAVSDLPAGVLAVPASGTVTAGGTEPILFRADSSATLGNAAVTITGTSGGLTHTASLALTVTPPAPPDVLSLTLSPNPASVVVNSYTVVSVDAAGPSGFTGPVTVTPTGLPPGVFVTPSSITVTPGTPGKFVVAAGATAQPGSTSITFTGRYNSVSTTATLNLAVVAPTSPGPDVSTWHTDNGRTGLNAAETALTPANVASAGFGKLRSFATDGHVDAQPLFLSAVLIQGQSHNVLYVASENDSIYAYDADSSALLWHASALGTNEAASDDRGCSELSPTAGISATPVIDRYAGANGAIYFVAMSKDNSGSYHQRLHALDLTTGAELAGSPTEIAASFAGNGPLATAGLNIFDSSRYVERAALLLSNSTLYLTWAAPCGQTTQNYGSWVMAYSAATLQQLSVLNLTPNGSGGAIWMSGAGPAADADGNVFLATSEGTFDTSLNPMGYPQNNDYGNGFVKIATENAAMRVVDYFEPITGVPGSANYQDQGTGGLLLVPDPPPSDSMSLSLALAAGRDGNIYELARAGSNLGQYGGSTDGNYNTLVQALPHGSSATPAYFNQSFYYGGIGDTLKAYQVQDSTGAVVTQSATVFADPGTTPVISANGTSAGIVWALEAVAGQSSVLHAYDATNLTHELYNSTQAQVNGVPRDSIGPASSYAIPVVVHGHAYVGTQTGVVDFGLLP